MDIGIGGILEREGHNFTNLDWTSYDTIEIPHNPGFHIQCLHRFNPKHVHNFKIPILFFKRQFSI